VGPRVNFLLDTTVFVDWANGLLAARRLVDDLLAKRGDLYTCAVVSCEALSGGSDDQRAAIERLLDALEFVALDPDGARYAGGLRREAGRSSGRTLGDALIAALAWRLGATVVTRNASDFASLGVEVLEYGRSTS
jgi:predicted nucleic acid-binding protein